MRDMGKSTLDLRSEPDLMNCRMTEIAHCCDIRGPICRSSFHGSRNATSAHKISAEEDEFVTSCLEILLLQSPIQWQMRLEMLDREMMRLATRENCFDDIWGEHCALQYLPYIATPKTRLFGQMFNSAHLS